MKIFRKVLVLAIVICGIFSTVSFAQTSDKQQITNLSRRVVVALKQKDMKMLAASVHPKKGLRFSPYGFINKATDLVFKKSQIKDLKNSRKVYNWGDYDSADEAIKSKFSDYYAEFVYDKNFANAPNTGYNKIIGQGNTLINLGNLYPNAKFVEYNFAGTEKYGTMDWKSLRLIFEKQGSRWYLVGISHDGWTI